MKKWIKAIISACICYELGLCLSSFLVPNGVEWIQILMKMTAQVSATTCGILVLLLYDKDDD